MISADHVSAGTVDARKNLEHGAFFRQYHVRDKKLAAKQPPKVTTKVVETMAWRDGKRVGFGSKEYIGSTRWIRLGAPAYTLYSVADSAHPSLTQPPPPVARAA